MTDLISILVTGVSLGGVYALVALGMVLIYRSTEVISFAHPALLVLGTLLVAELHGHGWPFWAAMGGGLLLSAAIGAVIELVLVRPFLRTRAALAAGIMTIGLSIVIETLTTDRIGARIMSTGDPWGDGRVDLAGITVPTARIAALVIAVVLVVALHLLLHRTDFGLALRAAAEDPEVAQLMGVRLWVVSITAWAIASLLAVIAGVFLVSYPSAGLDSSVTTVALMAIPAVVIGGIDSTTGAIVGGLVVGLTQALTLGYQAELDFLGRSFSQGAPYLVMFVVLLIRPAGLFGTREVERV